MKKILLLAAMAGFTFMNAQTVVFSENFDGETVDATTYAQFTSNDVDGDGNFWEVADMQAIIDGGQTGRTLMSGLVADSDSWESAFGAMSPDNYLTTTNQIDLTNASGTIELKFAVGTYQVSGSFIADKYSIYFTDSNDPAVIATETPLYTGTLADVMVADQADGSASEYLQTIDLSAYAGMSKYLTFRHYDTTDENSVLIDNVVVEAATVGAINDNVLSSSVSIFPNVATDNFTVKNTSNIALTSVSLFDINGRVVSTTNLNNLIGEKSINVSNLSTGMYFVEINSADAKITRKLIKK